MKFKAITLDPPWEYKRTVGQGVANKQYGLMTWDDLKSLGPMLHAVAEPDCAIFLWTCSPLLMETTDMVRAWGFRYITKAFSWLKMYVDGSFFVGLGSHTRGNTEDVWLLSNGTPKRGATDVLQIVPTFDDALLARIGRHSAKPEEMYRRVERYIDGPYLEVFARRQRPGWVCLGNEIDGLDIRDALQRVAEAPDSASIDRPRIIAEQPALF